MYVCLRGNGTKSGDTYTHLSDTRTCCHAFVNNTAADPRTYLFNFPGCLESKNLARLPHRFLETHRKKRSDPPRATSLIGNTFTGFLEKLKNHLDNQTNGGKNTKIVCVPGPHSVGSGFLMMAVPTSQDELCSLTYKRTQQIPKLIPYRDISDQYPIHYGYLRRCYNTWQVIPKGFAVAVVPEFKWCIRSATGTHDMGDLEDNRCQEIIYQDETESDPFEGFPEDDWDQCVNEKPHPVAPTSRMGAVLFHAKHSITPALNGTFWLCNHTAYEYLPIEFKGTCALIYYLPAFRLLNSTPEVNSEWKKWHDLNSNYKPHTRGQRDLFHQQSFWSRFFGALLPNYGVKQALDQIRDLSHELEAMARAAVDALGHLAHEQVAIRMVVLQKRMALDYLLASQGGACAIIGPECCTCIEDESSAVYNDTSLINDVATRAYDLDHTVSDEACAWWNLLCQLLGWLNSIGLDILSILAIILGICICIRIAWALIKRSCQTCPERRRRDKESSPIWTEKEGLISTLSTDDGSDVETGKEFARLQRIIK
ncbi:uncharacterized protein LOC132807014 [Hemiscyllium ocellatum]|uniref:uncharacterized protein LOC132807014 n=1 Tax=Hemiscyllium ocellatum TaxID=170820 RepID=UPI002965FD4C|nr:uncharacterized protein LOC132807014 [Hemiscyllium ocellatum]XP_060677277.1 uncharacterized protein LOC132807014 [Hemiscyllium ocellatum]XP_060677278.1 uncharacterized protein LOC132807014 [Hemiscyllium ocellatum]XP_060677280.1 uncharacterized protein LOC132807014 [Hemiscyllium ocellatum]